MVIKTIKLLFKNNASETEKDFEGLNNTLDDTAKAQDAVNKSAKNVNSTFEEVYGKTLQPLTTRLGEAEDRMYELALAGDTTSKEYQELLQKVAEYRRVQIKTDEVVDGAAQTLTGKLGSALNGVTSGFAATQGAMALFGSENEKLEKSLLKVQGALAIQQGIKGLTTAYRELTISTTIASAAQSAFAFVTGGASTALKVLRGALITTGIGALVVGIGLLIANFEKLAKAFDPVIQGLKDFGDWIGLTSYEEDRLELQRQKNAIEQRKREKEAIDAAVKYRDELKKTAELEQRYSNSRIQQLEIQKKLAEGNAKEIGKIDKQITDEKIAQLKRDKDAFIENQQASLKIIEANIKSNAAAEERIRKGISAAGKNFYKNKEENEKAFAKLQEQLRTQNFQDLVEIDNQIAAVEAEARVREKAELKKRQDNYKNYLKDRLDASRKIEDLENELLEDGIEKELEINSDRFRRLIEDTKKNTKLTREERNRLIELYEEQGQQKAEDIRAKYRQKEIDAERKLQQQLEAERNAFEDEIAAIQEGNYEALLTDQERELRAVQDKYFRLQELAQGNAEALNEIEIARLNEENEINLKYQNEAYEAQKALNEQEIADAKATQEAKIQFTNDAFGAVGELANAFAGESEKSQKRAFQINKAVGIAQAIVNTAGAISAAINPAVGGLGIPAGLPGAALAAATGAAQIATIAKTKFQGGSSGDVSAPSEAGLGEAVTPEFNVVGESGVNQLAQLQQQPTQAYVVSGDVTSAQALDRNRVENATL